MLLKKNADFGGEKKIIWFRVFVILPNVKFWEKIKILTLVLSEKKILNKTKNHNTPPYNCICIMIFNIGGERIKTNN
jgi:hypothetical protein